MKVYIAELHYDYEGFEILGVFKDENDAKKCLENHKHFGDERKITEHEVE